MKYEIKGTPLPVAICYLEAGEKMITEKGSMSWMSPNMEMETNAGGFGKALGRMFSGESMFRNTYSPKGGNGMIGFLASESTVELSVHIQKKLGAGFFGGEGFIMQKLSGHGMAFVEFDGAVMEYDLAAGQSIVLDTGYLAAMEATCNMEIQQVAGLKNKLLGGEGFFNTVVTGPGKVYIQTMPINKVAGAITPYIPTSSN